MAGGRRRRRPVEGGDRARDTAAARPGRAHAAGREGVRVCAHRDGWVRANGEAQCRSCGVRRFADYRAVRPPGLAEAVTRPRREARNADRAAALWLMRRTRWTRRRQPAPYDKWLVSPV
ncbi:DUF6255 family natural product biosynthesis protein [Streptomyces sp. NPDC020379]|uniref:DUF6255 family natural product biosynthesis protein n=1 Tax=Streptomyces sp. NPDC020379 TaxID=3365071 RepID=UPI00379930D6